MQQKSKKSKMYLVQENGGPFLTHAFMHVENHVGSIISWCGVSDFLHSNCMFAFVLNCFQRGYFNLRSLSYIACRKSRIVYINNNRLLERHRDAVCKWVRTRSDMRHDDLSSRICKAGVDYSSSL